jgi:hypothetical protein
MRLLRPLAALGSALPATMAHACTVCDSPTGHQLRAGLFNGHFLRTLGIVVTPVPVFFVAVLLLHRGMPDLPDASGTPPFTRNDANDFSTAEPAL